MTHGEIWLIDFGIPVGKPSFKNQASSCDAE